MKAKILMTTIAASALAGCGLLGGLGGKAPDVLFTITPEAAPGPQTTRSGSAAEAITVVRPTVHEALNTVRIPVRTSDTTVAYLVGAQWVDTPHELFRRLLSETIAARTGRPVLDPLQFTFNPGTRLTGQLHNFGLDATRMEAVVTYEGALARGEEGVVTRRFEARVPVAVADRENVVPALNQAANRVAAEVAAWIG